MSAQPPPSSFDLAPQPQAVWLFDLGNSRLKCAPLGTDGRPGTVTAIGHDGMCFEPTTDAGANSHPNTGLDARLDALLPARCEAAYVASVAAPALRMRLLEALARRFGRIVRPCTLPALAGLRIAYADPAALGVDRFLAMLGARARGSGPWLVVGVGTALTIDLIDVDGRHRGGRIAPSPALMRASLHARAAQLPETGGALRDFADNTPDALRSGCDGAALALIERARSDAEALLGAAPRLLLHGGGAVALGQRPAAAEDAHSLVLDGMAAWVQATTSSTTTSDSTEHDAGTAAAPHAPHTMPAC